MFIKHDTLENANRDQLYGCILLCSKFYQIILNEQDAKI